MRRLAAFLLALAIAAFPASTPAQAILAGTTYSGLKIGSPILLGTAATSATSPAVVTTSATAPGGQLIAALAAACCGAFTVSDQVLNTYTVQRTAPGTVSIGAGYNGNPTSLPSGDTMSVASAGASIAVVGVSVSGVNTSTPFDNIASGTTGTSASPSVTEGTPTNKCRIAFAELMDSQTGVTTEAAGWTTFADTASAGGLRLHIAYQNVCQGSPVALTYAPTLGSSIAWYAAIVSFQPS